MGHGHSRRSLPESMTAWETVGAAGPERVRRVERPVPRPRVDEALVEVEACGVCRTDLHVTDGDLPEHRPNVVPGHEVVGHVVALGEDVPAGRGGPGRRRLAPQHVRGLSLVPVRSGEPLSRSTVHRGDEDGGYAQLTAVPEAYAYRIPEPLAAEQAAPSSAPASSATGPSVGRPCRRAAGSGSTGSGPVPTSPPSSRSPREPRSMS